MRFAIFSDVHANLEALEAVLADARARNARVLCAWVMWSAITPIQENAWNAFGNWIALS